MAAVVSPPTTTELVCSANELLSAHAALISRARHSQQDNRRQLHSLHSPPQDLLQLPLIPSPSPSPPPESPVDEEEETERYSQPAPRADLIPAKRARVARYRNYIPEEETIRNDYSQRYVDGGEWPQNWVLGADPEHRFEEYPKQQRLLSLKKASVSSHSLQPNYLSFQDISSLQPSKFDVILLDPPYSTSFTWDHLQELPIPSLAADPSFVFLWVGSGAGEGLERGREVLAKWGYRRCEDVVWVKTNTKTNRGPGTDPPTTSLLTRTKQHCLIGIRGTVRRSTDSWFVHCNVDTDVIIWEGDPADPTRKPPEMYTLIENFCLGVRRLEVFGHAHSSLRRGWVTVLGPGQDEILSNYQSGGKTGVIQVPGEEGGEASKWERESWEEGLKQLANGGKAVVPMTPEIDALRPKSPFRPGQQNTGTNSVGNGGTTSLPVNAGGPRFGVGVGNRAAFGMRGTAQVPVPGQNQMGIQPMMGMGMNNMNMGMGNGIGMEDVMGGWNPMLHGNMNVPGMGGMGNVGVGLPGMGMPVMNQMGMPGGFQNQGSGFNPGMVFNANMPNAGMGWADQSQFPMEGGWEGDGSMNVGMNGMGMGMNGHMGMGQWGGGNFEGY
ncbi:MT-A70-domain-containing protein [Pluteus cervinus]|uniref:MT-A70-domain-containing protein n=1 Tax=Pluteus cervinus TaxID=181527 RepID=A0ACD3AVZ9_9AGAR|nr:MT-A70-domain-containing protein [Pluteus cervinus]